MALILSSLQFIIFYCYDNDNGNYTDNNSDHCSDSNNGNGRNYDGKGCDMTVS